MKLPVTDQFLWDIFNATNDAYADRPWKNKNKGNFVKFIDYLKRKNYIKVKNV